MKNAENIGSVANIESMPLFVIDVITDASMVWLVVVRTSAPSRPPSPKTCPSDKIATTASLPCSDNTVILTLPFWMKKTASATSPWLKIFRFFSYFSVVLPTAARPRKACGSKVPFGACICGAFGMVRVRKWAGAQHSQSPAKAWGGAVMPHLNPIKCGRRLKSQPEIANRSGYRQKRGKGSHSRKETAPGGGAPRPLGSLCRGIDTPLNREVGNRSPADQRKRAIQASRTRFRHVGIERRHDPNSQCWLTLHRSGFAPAPNLRLAASARRRASRWRRISGGRWLQRSSERGRISGTRRYGNRSRTAPIQASTAASGSGCSWGSAAARSRQHALR